MVTMIATWSVLNKTAVVRKVGEENREAEDTEVEEAEERVPRIFLTVKESVSGRWC